jgi:hypothetical protein
MVTLAARASLFFFFPPANAASRILCGAGVDLSLVNVGLGRVETLGFRSVLIETAAMVIRYFVELHCVNNKISICRT